MPSSWTVWTPPHRAERVGEVDPAAVGREVDKSLAELRMAGGRLDDFEVRSGGLEVGVEEGGVVAVAGHGDADVGDRSVGRLWRAAGGAR